LLLGFFLLVQPCSFNSLDYQHSRLKTAAAASVFLQAAAGLAAVAAAGVAPLAD